MPGNLTTGLIGQGAYDKEHCKRQQLQYTRKVGVVIRGQLASSGQQQMEWWVREEPTLLRMSFLCSLSFIPHSLPTLQNGTALSLPLLKRSSLLKQGWGLLDLRWEMESKRSQARGTGSQVPTSAALMPRQLMLFLVFQLGFFHLGAALWSKSWTRALQAPTPGKSIEFLIEFQRQLHTQAFPRGLLTFLDLSALTSILSQLPGAGKLNFFCSFCTSSKQVTLGGDYTLIFLALRSYYLGQQVDGPGSLACLLAIQSRKVALLDPSAGLMVWERWFDAANSFYYLDLRASKYLLSTWQPQMPVFEVLCTVENSYLIYCIPIIILLTIPTSHQPHITSLLHHHPTITSPSHYYITNPLRHFRQEQL